MTTSRLRPTPAALAAALALTCLGAGRLAAQQPGAQPATQPATPSRDPRQIILDKLKLLDARRDTARDTTAVSDTSQAAQAPAPAPRAAAASAPGVPPIQDDSISTELMKLPGFVATKYSAESARFAADSERLILKAGGEEAPAVVIQGDQAMTADTSLVFNQRTQIACGYGKPVLTGGGQDNPVESQLVCYNVKDKTGIAYGAKTKFQPQGQSTAWYVDGKKIYTSGRDTLFSREAQFTDCNLVEQGKEPHYHFTASQVKIVGKDVMVARDVVLSFADVPVFWLPFYMQSMAQGRRSGILMPRFDLNDIARTNANYQRRLSNVGFYWAINDHFGELTALDWFSGNYTALNTALDWSFRRQFLNGGLSVKQYWQTTGSKQLTLSASNSWRPDERTTMNLSANYASSSQFVQQQSFDPLELNRSIDSNLGIQRRFSWGSLDFAGSRRQTLQDDRVVMRLPSISLSLTPVTFFKAPGDDAHFWNNITWNGSGNYSADQNKAQNIFADPAHTPSTTARQAGFSSSLNVGKFSWSQTVNYNENNQLYRPLIPDSSRSGGTVRYDTLPAIDANSKGTMTWSTSLGFQQRLFGTSSINPSLSISGQSQRLNAIVTRYDSAGKPYPDTVNEGMTPAPIRMSFGVGTQMDIYGFWPGVGPFARIRHKLSPSFSYTYSPAPSTKLTDAQRKVYGLSTSTSGAITEVNRLTIGLNQTIEAKYRESAKDSAAADSAAAASQPADDGEPRRLPQTRKITLLALGTSAVAYDFTEDTIHHRRFGFGSNLTLSNDIRSDLIPGLQFSLQHSLIDTTATGRRKFSPFLTNASTSFTLNDKSWLFRVLGLASRHRAQAQGQDTTRDTTTSHTTAVDQAESGTGMSMVPRADRRDQGFSPGGGVGSWNASFTYNLSRQRPSKYGTVPCIPSVLTYCPTIPSNGTQMVQMRFGFQPTPMWRVSWTTGYDITNGRFADHYLQLTRDLHDWEANFSFVKAQNGNFSVQFRVDLKAQPDLKFDYRQASGGYYNNY